MSFIGFLVKRKDEKNFRELLKNIICEEAIAINEKSISNIKNVHFETVIMDKNIIEARENDLNEIVKNVKYLIINADKVDMSKIKDANLTIITYGFNNKSTITASSVEDDNLLICLQRNIKGIKGNEIEPQEVKQDQDAKLKDSYLKMALVATELIYHQKITKK